MKKNKTCYIVGSGPSLSQLTLGELRLMEKGFIIVCNWSYKVIPSFDVLCLSSDCVALSYFKDRDVKYLDFEKSLNCDIISPHYENTIKKKYKLKIAEGNGYDKKIVKYSDKAEYFALNFALHLNFKHYILIGYNCTEENWVLETSSPKNGTNLINFINTDFSFAKDKITNLRGNLKLNFEYKHNLK